MSHCNFPFSLQLLCPDEDDLIHVSLHADPELNPTEKALVQSSCGPSAQQLLLPRAPDWRRPNGLQRICTRGPGTDHQTESTSRRRTNCSCLLPWRKIKLSRCVCLSYCATRTTASAFQAPLGEREQALAPVHDPKLSFWHSPQGHPDSGLAL